MVSKLHYGQNNSKNPNQIPVIILLTILRYVIRKFIFEGIYIRVEYHSNFVILLSVGLVLFELFVISGYLF